MYQLQTAVMILLVCVAIAMIEYKCDYCKNKIEINDLVCLKFEPAIQGFLPRREFEFHRACAEKLSIAIQKGKLEF